MYTVQHIIGKRHDPVATISPDGTVLQAAKIMNERHIGALVVTRHDEVVGIFTERDILNRLVAPERSLTETRIRDVMTTPVACCRRETGEAECRSLMRRKHIRHLVVVEEERLVGVISIGDVIEDQNDEMDDTIHYLNEYLYSYR